MDASQQNRETNADQRERLIVSRRFYVANSVLVICLCIPVTAFGLAGVLIAGSHFGIAAIALMFMVIVVSLGILQYAACFRRSGKAAGYVCVMSFASGLFTCFIAGVILNGTTLSFEFLWILAILVPPATYAFFCGWINYRWITLLCGEQRRAAISRDDSDCDNSDSNTSDTETPLRAYQFTLLELLLATAVVAAIAGLTSYLVRLGPG
jgi:hypothetical protein